MLKLLNLRIFVILGVRSYWVLPWNEKIREANHGWKPLWRLQGYKLEAGVLLKEKCKKDPFEDCWIESSIEEKWIFFWIEHSVMSKTLWLERWVKSSRNWKRYELWKESSTEKKERKSCKEKRKKLGVQMTKKKESKSIYMWRRRKLLIVWHWSDGETKNGEDFFIIAAVEVVFCFSGLIYWICNFVWNYTQEGSSLRKSTA